MEPKPFRRLIVVLGIGVCFLTSVYIYFLVVALHKKGMHQLESSLAQTHLPKSRQRRRQQDDDGYELVRENPGVLAGLTQGQRYKLFFLVGLLMASLSKLNFFCVTLTSSAGSCTCLRRNTKTS